MFSGWSESCNITLQDLHVGRYKERISLHTNMYQIHQCEGHDANKVFIVISIHMLIKSSDKKTARFLDQGQT